MKHKLTVKQQKFCDEYIRSGNATEAALKAGYRSRTAYSIGNENLKKPELKKYIEEKIKEIESAKLATAQETLEYLTSVMRGEQTETVVTAKGIYKNVEVSAKDRITAAKELLKRYPVDPLSKMQLRKINAEADLTEARVKAMQGNNSTQEDKVAKMMGELQDAIRENTG
ncbi:terminase small subunit [Lactobacillus melliventris]|uniref:Terminase small subunit n=1 Tax=Lactobacillus melliventris TaxID=1218507 RepID=A0ABX5N4Z6_9LACO|nr:terminase small subunit [Lactobacillus melliventris]PXY84358.1 terminase small subunit [Lactobacillus melliventris]